MYMFIVSPRELSVKKRVLMFHQIRSVSPRPGKRQPEENSPDFFLPGKEEPFPG
jgi:hypothetical protein